MDKTDKRNETAKYTDGDDIHGIEISCFFGISPTGIDQFLVIFFLNQFILLNTVEIRRISGLFSERSGLRAGSGQVADETKCEKIVVRIGLKTRKKRSIRRILNWSYKPFKVHFST